MSEETLNILNELSKKETTDLALNIMELTADNMVKDKEIERLNNILNELEKETRCGYYEYSSSDGDYIEGYDDGASKTADFFNKMIKELRGDKE